VLHCPSWQNALYHDAYVCILSDGARAFEVTEHDAALLRH
jgi:hypothetical protein